MVEVHSVTSQKIVLLIVTTVRTSDPEFFLFEDMYRVFHKSRATGMMVSNLSKSETRLVFMRTRLGTFISPDCPLAEQAYSFSQEIGHTALHALTLPVQDTQNGGLVSYRKILNDATD
jgi:hypothetical protein